MTITRESASLPYPAREITVTVTEVLDAERQTIRDQILGEEQSEPERSYLLDITLWHGEEEIEPTGSVTVTFSGIDTEGLTPRSTTLIRMPRPPRTWKRKPERTAT